MNILLLIWACADSFLSLPDEPSVHTTVTAPTALPPSILDLQKARGEMVKFNNIEGFLAQRIDYEGDLAILVMRDPQEDGAQRGAIALAETPALVLLVGPEVNIKAATAYLEGIPGIQRVEHQRQTKAMP